MNNSRQHLQESVDAVVDRAIAGKRIIGAVVIVSRSGERIYQQAAGWADCETRRPMARDTIFRYASLAKPLVTVAALRLVEQQRLALDGEVTEFLPDFVPKLADGAQPAILIRHLLSHSAGLSYRFLEPPDSAYHRLDISDGLDLRDFGLEENLRRLVRAPLAFRPGTAWRYSLATDVLGAVLQRATGKTLPEIVNELVCKPLGMKDSGFAVTEPRQKERLALPYYNAEPEPKELGDNEEIRTGDAVVRFTPSRILHSDARLYSERA